MERFNLNKTIEKFVRKYWGNSVKYSNVVKELYDLMIKYGEYLAGSFFTDYKYNIEIDKHFRTRGIFHFPSFKKGYDSKTVEIMGKNKHGKLKI